MELGGGRKIKEPEMVQKLLEWYKDTSKIKDRKITTREFKEKNLESMKQNEDVKINNDCCSRCKKDFTSSLKACPHCSSLFCKLCLKEIFGNENIKNINLNEKNCPNCINLTSLQSLSTVFVNKKKKNSQISQEPLDTCEEEDPKIENQFTEEKIIKDLDEQSKGFEALISKIENKKKSIEAQKNIGKQRGYISSKRYSKMFIFSNGKKI